MWKILLFTGISLTSLANADIFAFRDITGFSKCLSSEAIVEVTKTETGKQMQGLDRYAIRLRCIEQAEKLLSNETDSAKIRSFIDETKALSAPENATGLIGRLVTVSPAACNDMGIYEVYLKLLAGPKPQTPSRDPQFTAGVSAIKLCLKNAEFKKDFLEEKENTNPQIAANACDILVAEKLVKRCP